MRLLVCGYAEDIDSGAYPYALAVHATDHRLLFRAVLAELDRLVKGGDGRVVAVELIDPDTGAVYGWSNTMTFESVEAACAGAWLAALAAEEKERKGVKHVA